MNSFCIWNWYQIAVYKQMLRGITMFLLKRNGMSITKPPLFLGEGAGG